MQLACREEVGGGEAGGSCGTKGRGGGRGARWSDQGSRVGRLVVSRLLVLECRPRVLRRETWREGNQERSLTPSRLPQGTSSLEVFLRPPSSSARLRILQGFSAAHFDSGLPLRPPSQALSSPTRTAQGLAELSAPPKAAMSLRKTVLRTAGREETTPLLARRAGAAPVARTPLPVSPPLTPSSSSFLTLVRAQGRQILILCLMRVGEPIAFYVIYPFISKVLSTPVHREQDR